METLKTIKNRVKTVSSIIKATTAMKMVASIKLSRVSNQNKAAKDCSGLLEIMLKKALYEIQYSQVLPVEHWINKTEGKKLLLVLATDQGFCGAFSQSVIETAKKTIIEKQPDFIEVFGKKARSLETKKPNNIVDCNIESRYNIDDYSKNLSELVFDYIANHEVKEIYLISGKFKNVLTQKIECSQILPISTKEKSEIQLETTIEGNPLNFVENLFHQYLKTLLTAIITEHLTSELSARVMAMDNSVKNANEMFAKLNSLYNKVRQAKITQELTEIVASIECVR